MSETKSDNNGNGQGTEKTGEPENEQRKFMNELEDMISQVLRETKGTASYKHASQFIAATVLGLTAQTLLERYDLPPSSITGALRLVADKAEHSMRARGVFDGPENPASLAGYL